jgi:hypothetical protein
MCAIKYLSNKQVFFNTYRIKQTYEIENNRFQQFKRRFYWRSGRWSGRYHSPLHLVQSGMGATAGLYGAIMVGIFAAIFGGTPTQASGPTGPMTDSSFMLLHQFN